MVFMIQRMQGQTRNKSGYSPYCFNDFKPGICNKPRTKCTECKQSNFAPLDRKQLEKHLLGSEVIIYDYVDVHIPVLERMYHKRLTAYRSLGYSIKTSSSTSDLESGIFDDSNYLDPVLKDIERAKKHVLISSPYLQKKKIEKVKDLLLKIYSSGIRVTLCSNEIVGFPDKQMNYIKEIFEEMSGKGIDVIQIKNNRYRFMIIDSRIVWYGGIDILGRNLNEQSLIRIDNEALASELAGIIYEHMNY